MTKLFPVDAGKSVAFSRNTLFFAGLAFLAFLATVTVAPGSADVVVLESATDGGDGGRRIRAVATAFGLTVRMASTPDEFFAQAHEADRLRKLDALIISAEILDRVDRPLLLSFFRAREAPVAVLILDITRELHPELLLDWSDGAIRRIADRRAAGGKFRVSELERLARGLSGFEFSFPEPILYSVLELEARGREDGFSLGTDGLLSIDNGEGRTGGASVLVRRFNGREEVFLSGKIRLERRETAVTDSWPFDPQRFIEAVPLFLFLRYLRSGIIAYDSTV